jgi:hypothetical protein
MADRIPIKFEHQDKTIVGNFQQVAGAGSAAVWHLYDHENYYLGRLRLQGDHWVFDTNKGSAGFESLADFFADYITAWLE